MWPLGFPGSIFPRSPRNHPPVVIWPPTSNSGAPHSCLKPLGHRASRHPARFRYVTKERSSRIGSYVNGKSHCNTDRPARRLFWLAGLTGAVALVFAPLSFHVERRLDTSVRLEGSESDYVAQQLATRFRSPFVDRVVLVIQGLPPADSEEGAQALTQIVGALKGPDVSGIVSRLDLPDPIFLGQGGGTFVLIGLAPVNGLPESLVPKIRERARILQDQFRNR